MKHQKYIVIALIVLSIIMIAVITSKTNVINYAVIGFVYAILILVVIFLLFEWQKPDARKIIPIVVMCATASAGRAIFVFIPQIQPVTAIVIIMGISFGAQAGFMTGALTAFVSNMILGQGFWTPFQMLAWGFIGLLSGVISKYKVFDNIILISIFAFLSGIIYGIIADIWTVLFFSGNTFNINIIIGVYLSSQVFNIIHGVGNVVFILLLYKPLTIRFARIRKKIGN